MFALGMFLGALVWAVFTVTTWVWYLASREGADGVAYESHLFFNNNHAFYISCLTGAFVATLP